MKDNLKHGIIDSVVELNKKLTLFNNLDRSDLERVAQLYDARAFHMCHMSPVQATIELFKYRFSQPRQMGTSTLVKDIAKTINDTNIIVFTTREIIAQYYKEDGEFNGVRNVEFMSADRYKSRPIFYSSPRTPEIVIISDEIDSLSNQYKKLMDNIFNYIAAKGFPILLLDFSR